MLKDEAKSYGIYIIDEKHYYIPNAHDAWRKGFFMLEDSGKIMKVDGINHNVMPTMLKFHEYKDNDILFVGDSLAIAKIATKEFLEKEEMRI